jgi:alanine racemase
VSFGARALIRLGAIKDNFQTIKERSHGAHVMAVIKRNAYGHGLLAVAGCLTDADCFAVARLKEATDIRSAGINTPIALFGGVLSERDLVTAIDLNIHLGVHNESQLVWLERFGRADATVWLKIDTGMNRLGFRPHEAANLIERLQDCAAVSDLRLMTHLANADDVQDDTTISQIDQFRTIADGFDGDISIANSAGILGWENELEVFAEQRSNGRLWVRPGLALYGISPFPDCCGADLGLRPAMRFESRLIAVKALSKGASVGYGGTWQAEQDTVLGIVAAGYGDGYSRFIPSGSPLIVNDRRVKIAGLVSMDLTAVDLGPAATDKVGDPVLLWGDELPVEELARNAGTIPYQLVCGVTHREDCDFEN